MNNFSKLANGLIVEKTIKSLKQNGFNVMLTSNKTLAKQQVLSMIPKGSQVMTMSSMTLEETGLNQVINESGKYDSLRQRLSKMDAKTQKPQMRMIGAAPIWAVGSVHAITQKGEVLIASNTGSQLPAYAYGAEKVIWVVGTQKIVKDINEGMKRIYEYCLKLENQRALKAYGVKSSVNKILIINKEIIPQRINIVLVEEKLGF